LPRLVNFACDSSSRRRQRAKIVPLATGNVLEVGIGSGLNLPFYTAKELEGFWALDPSEETWALARALVEQAPFPVEFLHAPAEEIPLASSTIDTVVITYSLCTIPDPKAALGEMRRVLRPGGRLLFCEHGLSPDESVRSWQERLNPLWRVVGGGCNLNRDIPALIEAGDFKIQELNTMYLPGWKLASFDYWGAAS
jgi:ubiquinone/menaquinone biosynthesis C-methylase UbiE